PPARATAPASAPPATVVPPATPVPPPSAAPAVQRPAWGTPAAGGSARPGTPYRGGPDLASTVYGGTEGPGFATVSFPAGNPLENSGSLTGHILAQGWADTPTERSRTTRVVVVLAASLGLLVAISVLVVLLANDAMDGLVGSILSK
ncbi:hypothetical protein ACSNN7_27950, partial [Micromonospora sp. URMC 105]